MEEGPVRTLCLHQSFQHRAQCLVLNWFSVWKNGSQGGKERENEGRKEGGGMERGQVLALPMKIWGTHIEYFQLANVNPKKKSAYKMG